ncbi:hypothetical protein, partial [Dyadobacter arcticus]
GNQFTASNLEFDTGYGWLINNFSNVSACGSLPLIGKFKTGPEPDEFDLGFTVMVDDHESNSGIPIVGPSLTYKVKVTRPDGTIDFQATDRYSNGAEWVQVDFKPGEGQIIANGDVNGQLTDQTGDYTIELEILTICPGCNEPNATPKITIKGKEFRRKVGESNWILNEEFFPNPPIQTFPGRVIGAKKTLKFHYELP